MLKPLADRVVIERVSEKPQTKSGIVLPDSSKEKPEIGKIVEVGKEVKELKKGDQVVFAKYGPSEVKIDDKEYLIVKEEDILAVIA